MGRSSSSSTHCTERRGRSFSAVIALTAAIGLSAIACEETSPRWSPDFSPVDSGLGPAASLYTYYSGSSQFRMYPQISWSADGSALLVASVGPRLVAPPEESSLWAVLPPDAGVNTIMTLPGSDQFIGIRCYTGTTDCDLLRFTGVILRRKANGDTVRLMKTPSRFFTSANGRFIVSNPQYGEYPPGGPRMSILDVTTGITTLTTIPDATGLYSQPRSVAVSDDGAEISVTNNDFFTITRYRVDNGTPSTWTIAKPVGWTTGYVRDLRYVGATLHALVEWRSGDQMRFIQYAADGGPAIELGTTRHDLREFVPSFAWRPELQRLVVAPLSRCGVDPSYDPYYYYCLVVQVELELMQGGVTTRVARSSSNLSNLVLSPDGKWLGYAFGLGSFAIKALPD
jgi:hypothetical protein